jgi:hypothetical protein
MPRPEGRNVLSNSAAADFRKMQKKVLGGQPEQGDYGGASHRSGSTWYWAKTTSNVSIGSLEIPTTFTFDIWLPNSTSGAYPKPFLAATDSGLTGLTGTNRCNFSTSTTGIIFKVEYAFGEWSPKWADC